MVELASNDGESIKIGMRVTVADGYKGTVCYVGPVPPNSGIWIGIDWDDPSRGKHDGSNEGVRYFNARLPTSGSFVRKEKVNFGISCPDGIKLRYGDDVAEDEQELLLVKKALNAPFLEMVGFKDVNKFQSCFENLEIVWLHDYAISCAGKPNELKELSPNIREIDLSSNLLVDWYQVAEISKQLDNLSVLNLSKNSLKVPETNDLNNLIELNAFKNLEYLILGNMNYSWSDILQCAFLWPNIFSIKIPFNNILTLSVPEKPIFYNLNHLDLEGNNIGKWEEINKLGSLPELQSLNLTNTGISYVNIPSKDLFKSLKQLMLSNNLISSWADINELNKINLEDLRFRDNPLLKDCIWATSYQLIVARISSLKILNGQEISKEERRGAEYDYIKKYGQLWHDSKNNEELRSTFISEHSRYIDLIKKYGEAESNEYKQVLSTLKSSLLKLVIVAEPNGQIIKKSLPRSMLVQRFSGLVQKLFNTGSVVPKLCLVSEKNPNLKVSLDNNLKNLDFYSVEDGDSIVVYW